MTESNSINNGKQTGPWWSQILTNRNAVFALLIVYLVYFTTNLFDSGVAHIAAQLDHVDTSLAEHREADREHYARLEDLLVRLNDQAILQTRLARELCWSNAKNNEQRLKCFDANVK